MTAPTDYTDDPIRAFRDALSPAARHHLRQDYITIPVIRQACEKTSPAELARRVEHGIGWNHPSNAWACMWHRIRTAAGLTDDTEEALN